MSYFFTIIGDKFVIYVPIRRYGYFNTCLLARNEIFYKPITIIYLRPILVDVLKAKLLKFVPPSTQKILDIDMKLAS
jgi:hypothetical protein